MGYHFGRLTGGFVNELLGGGAAAEDSFKYNMQAIKYQNEYNKPINQMARLREAGLNPNLVYGGNSGSVSGNLSTAPTGNYQTRGGNLFDVLGGVMGAYDVFQSAQLKKANAEYAKNNAEYVKTQKDIAEHNLKSAGDSPFPVGDTSFGANVYRLANWLGIDGVSLADAIQNLIGKNKPASMKTPRYRNELREFERGLDEIFSGKGRR